MKGVVVIGSVVAGTAHPGSDIDAVIFFDPLDPSGILPAESIWRESDNTQWSKSNAVICLRWAQSHAWTALLLRYCDNTFHSIFADDVDLQENGLQLDMKQWDLRFWRSRSYVWPEPYRAELGTGWIAYDRTGSVGRLIGERTAYDETTRQSRLDEALVWLDQHLFGERPSFRWRDLGPLIAHDRLHAAYELLIQAFFAYHRQWRVWRNREMTALLQLPWLPADHAEWLLTALNAPSHDEAGYLRRVEVLKEAFQALLCQLQAEKTYGADPICEAFQRRTKDEPGRTWSIAEWNEEI